VAAVCLSGCAGSSAGNQRLTRYRPDGSQRRPWEWAYATAPAAQAPTAPAASDTDPESVAPAMPVPANGFSGVGDVLLRGDLITINLRNIPRPEDVREKVDEVGAVTLPLIGKINVAGMSTSAAEDAIKQAYIDNGYYRKIDVIVVAEAGSYYVRGEVKRPGSFPISGDVTLVQAITTAGGYTDFAKRSKIKVRRGQQDMVFDADRIEDGKDPDPLIKVNDTIIVPRRWM
jgi:polysaccharide export outer membrane protein